LPIYKCDECDGNKTYTLQQLPVLVRVNCPEDEEHGKMSYLGPKRSPWYQGHAFASLFLLAALFGVLCALAQNITDHSESAIILTVGLALAAFELGRISPSGGEKRFKLSVSQIRVLLFFSVTIIAMGVSQSSIDAGERNMLLILAAATIALHAVVFFVEWTRPGTVVKDLGWEFFKTFVMGVVAIVFATQIEYVSKGLKSFRSTVEDSMEDVRETLGDIFSAKP